MPDVILMDIQMPNKMVMNYEIRQLAGGQVLYYRDNRRYSGEESVWRQIRRLFVKTYN
jgi:CheY-like chemotaxis protein